MHATLTEATATVAESPATYAQCPVCGHDGAEDLLEAPDRFHGGLELYQLIRCPSCLLVWLKDPPLPSEMSQHYGQDYDRWIAAAGEDPDHWRERRDTILQYESGGALLDLGCSSGGFLASMRMPSWRLFGIEMSDFAARKANARSGANVFVGDILDAPFAPASFDVITCFHVFEHLYEPREVLGKVSEWLKPGGVFYTMMPNIDSAGARIFRSYWYALELPRHLFHFSPTSLTKLATSVDLDSLSCATHRELFVEPSLRYIVDDFLRKMGMPRAPLARAESPSVPFRAVRKIFRWTVLPLFNFSAHFVGDGESIHAVFRKK